MFYTSVVERPQHMLMRVSVGIHHEDIDAAIEVIILYDLICKMAKTWKWIDKKYAIL
jgi:hypothetical protein